VVPQQPAGKAKLLVTSPVPITTFAWKPDSRTIVYGGGAMSNGELGQVTVDGRRGVAPFGLEGAPDQIAIAPNGARLAYVLKSRSNIWRAAGPEPPGKLASSRRLFASVREEMDPAFSPDGRSIAFVSTVQANDLWMKRGRYRVRELAAVSPAIPSAWSPDASGEIAFDSAAFGEIRSGSSMPPGSPGDWAAAWRGGSVWSRDGKQILFYTNAGGPGRCGRSRRRAERRFN
jgi:dipeptidyl aminopeptidase/acylaminoacyl peptidase